MACRIRLAGLVAMMLLAGCAHVEPRQAGMSPTFFAPRVRLMTYNVNWGAPGMEQTIGAILESGADVVCLQEITETWEKRVRAQLSGDYSHMLFRHHLFPSGGLAILSRWPVSEVAYVQPLGGWFPAWVLRVQSPIGELQVAMVHLYPPVPSAEGARHVKGVRREEIKSLLAHVKPDCPTVILGDFNESCQGLAVGYLLENGYADALRTHEQATGYLGAINTRARDTVDHILFSPHFDCHSATVLNRGASDHLPIVAVLSLRREMN